MYKRQPFQVVASEGSDDCRNYIGFFGHCKVVAEPTEEPADTMTARWTWFDADQVRELIDNDQLTPLDTAVVTQHVFKSLG